MTYKNKDKSYYIDLIVRSSRGENLNENEIKELWYFLSYLEKFPKSQTWFEKLFNKKSSDLPIHEFLESGEDMYMNDENIVEKINNIEKDNLLIKKDIEWLSRTFLPALITLGGLLVTVLIFGFSSLNSSVNSKFDVIQQQLQSQKEINQINIEKGISQELLKQKNRK